MPDPTRPAAAVDSQPTPDPAAVDDHLARGIRALALRKYNDACDALAQALDASTSRHGDLAPENVESLVLYGKALLGSAIAQSAVLGGAAPGTGGEGANRDAPAGAAGPSTATAASSSTAAASAGPSNPNFHFGGDAEDAEDEERGDGDADEGEDGEGDGEGDDGAAGGDREDDLESAFQMLDLARTILSNEIDAVEKELEEDAGERKEELEEKRRKRKEKLAEVHRLLGDVATESEQFDNAVEEYTSALSILSHLLPPYDRALSELHMLTALALEFVPNATSRAVAHAEKAKSVLVAKLDELERVPDDEREDKTRREIEDIKGLMGDVDMKIEDLRTVPTAPTPTATDSALEALLRQSSSAMAQAAASGSVNDLTGLVKKKKKAVPTPGIVEEHVEGEGRGKGGEEENVLVDKLAQGEEAAGKRKAEEVVQDEQEKKKVKVDGEGQ
ncbi:histone-binding protein [Rhodotorula toruloides]|uniref:Histone-binding protein n=1 Tax=Rhodotorula toruloides TaxID=5286 RepID=A0A511KFZ3_RHOTO|nr:histone-binding protein [Rhodotorula toruloides]